VEFYSALSWSHL